MGDDNVANPFVIKRRTPVLVPSLRSICIFKKQMPCSVFYEFIQQVSAAPIETSKILHIIKTNQVTQDEPLPHAVYMVDANAFKRGIYLDIVRPFMDMMAEQYYRPTHAFYAQRNMTGPAAFAQFIQVIRHICKHSNLAFISTLKYEQSISSRVYYIECGDGGLIKI